MPVNFNLIEVTFKLGQYEGKSTCQSLAGTTNSVYLKYPIIVRLKIPFVKIVQICVSLHMTNGFCINETLAELRN